MKKRKGGLFKMLWAYDNKKYESYEMDHLRNEALATNILRAKLAQEINRSVAIRLNRSTIKMLYDLCKLSEASSVQTRGERYGRKRK